jgi:hypothetical protein
MDFKFSCPHCSQHLEGPAELAGTEVTCPSCSNAFNVPLPPKANETARITLPPCDAAAGANGQKRHWVVDMRVLVVNSPPGYIQMLVEVPDSWRLPTDGNLPEAASEAVKKAASERFPRCPATPTKVHAADAIALKRISEPFNYSNEYCRVWFLGKTAPAP